MMFAGLDDVDWGAMEHAYGPAVEVPDLVRGLVSEDPAVREWALNGMYMGVHHQGDVYDSTLAVIPFLLEVAGTPGLPDRGEIVELLASIGGVDGDDEAYVPDEDDTYGQAADTVAAAYPLFVDLLEDADPDVRRAACTALLACRPHAAVVATALCERLRVETDATVQCALVAAVGRIGRSAVAGRVSGVDSTSVGASLAATAAEHTNSTVRLAAMTELVRSQADALPADVVPIALRLLSDVYATDAPTSTREPESAGLSSDTLVGALRELAERDAVGRRARQAAGLVRGLSGALGDRVEDRLELLTELLRSPEWECRHDAVRSARTLMEGWRGDYRELVFLVGEQLLDTEPRIAESAGECLKYLYELAEAAREALARSLDAAPRQAPYNQQDAPLTWIIQWPGGNTTTGLTLHALAALRDARVLPAVRWALEHEHMPEDIGDVVAVLGELAAELVPEILRRLRDLPAGKDGERRRTSLVAALREVGAAALPAVPDLVALLPDEGAMRALARLGPAAVEAVPVLHRLLDHVDGSAAVDAAVTLWRVEGDPGPVLPVLARHLDSVHAVAAAKGLAMLGHAATPQESRLRSLLSMPDPYGWLHLHAAEAVWRATNDAGSVLPVFSDVWARNPNTRTHIAQCLADMGPAGRPALPLLYAELAARRRHTAHPGRWTSHQVPEDEKLLRACRRALDAIAMQ